MICAACYEYIAFNLSPLKDDHTSVVTWSVTSNNKATDGVVRHFTDGSYPMSDG